MDHHGALVARATDPAPLLTARRGALATSLGALSQVPPRIVAIGRSQ